MKLRNFYEMTERLETIKAQIRRWENSDYDVEVETIEDTVYVKIQDEWLCNTLVEEVEWIRRACRLTICFDIED
jgi:hypothetical protein